MRTIMEIIDKKKIFTFSLEQNNFIISCDTKNELILYDKESKKIGDITESIDKSGYKNIFSLKEIMNNLIYITFNKNADNSNSTSNGMNSNFFNEEKEEPMMDTSASKNSIKDKVELGTKIIELDENSHKIKREYILSEKQQLIGAISERFILIRDDDYNSIIVFDAKMFNNVQRFYFEKEEKPIFCSALNRRENLIDFILVSDQMKILIQNIYDEENRNITQISGVRIKSQNNEIEKVGKILHIPFKGFIKYIGANKFVVVNY